MGIHDWKKTPPTWEVCARIANKNTGSAKQKAGRASLKLHMRAWSWELCGFRSEYGPQGPLDPVLVWALRGSNSAKKAEACFLDNLFNPECWILQEKSGAGIHGLKEDKQAGGQEECPRCHFAQAQWENKGTDVGESSRGSGSTF